MKIVMVYTADDDELGFETLTGLMFGHAMKCYDNTCNNFECGKAETDWR